VWIIVLNTQNLKLLGVDLCRPDLLTSVLEAVDIDFGLPTLILSEVVLTYLSPARYDELSIIYLFVSVAKMNACWSKMTQFGSGTAVSLDHHHHHHHHGLVSTYK